MQKKDHLKIQREERPQERPKPPMCWSWTPSLQKCEQIHFCCGSPQSVTSWHDSPSEQIQTGVTDAQWELPGAPGPGPAPASQALCTPKREGGASVTTVLWRAHGVPGDSPDSWLSPIREQPSAIRSVPSFLCSLAVAQTPWRGVTFKFHDRDWVAWSVASGPSGRPRGDADSGPGETHKGRWEGPGTNRLPQDCVSGIGLAPGLYQRQWFLGQTEHYKREPLGWNRSPAQVRCMRQVLRPGALGRPRGMGWGGRQEGASGWGTHVNPWLIHVNVWQSHYNIVK